MDDDTRKSISQLLAPSSNEVPEDVMIELLSISRVHSLTPQELSFKWESYNIKMDPSKGVTLNLDTVRDFKKDINDTLERETRAKGHNEKRVVSATPRANKGADLFDMIDGVAGSTSTGKMSTSSKRRNQFATPAAKASKQHPNSSPRQSHTPQTGPANIAFADRKGSGEVIESLNESMEVPNPPEVPFMKSRISVTANSELNKYAYRPMAMKLSSASEILDDRIDAFLDLIQQHHELSDSAFGNPAAQSPSEIITVGRIASDTPESRLNSASIVLETSRKSGAGLRVPVKLDDVRHYDFFPGKIVALKGTNPSGEAFIVTEVLDIPLLGTAASPTDKMAEHLARMQADNEDAEAHPLNIIFASGPYTSDDNLDYEPLHALCERAEQTRADALVLVGPFLDSEHPLVASGEFPEFPAGLKIDLDKATISDLFRALIGRPLDQLAQALPGLTIIMIPSIRDVINKHAAWPQDKVPKKGLGLPKNCFFLTNPMSFALNEVAIAASSQDVLFQLKRETCSKQAPNSQPIIDRLCQSVIEQRHFFPLFPPASRENLPKPFAVEGQDVEPRDALSSGASLDVSYLALGEWFNRRPDILVMPSSMPPFVKVIESVIVINPGSVSKKRGPGNFGQVYLRATADEENKASSDGLVDHEVYSRARVDIMRI